MDKLPRQIDLLLYEGANIVDIAGPAQVFSAALLNAAPAYRLRYVSLDGKAIQTSCGLRLTPDARLMQDSKADDLLIPGGVGTDAMLKNATLLQIIADWRKTRTCGRLISICSGALILAAAGVLDQRRATTHWQRDAQVKAQFPDVDWQIDQLYFADPPVMTSAGVSSGIDLALAIVRRDCGAASALTVAREMVVYLQRSGGQSQFTDLLEAQFCNDTRLQKLLDAMQQSPQTPWRLETMADFIGLTPRTLSRRFVKETGLAPVQFLERLRVKKSSDAISAGVATSKAIQIGGFSDFQQMQRGFKRQLNITVGAFSKRFQIENTSQVNLDGTSDPN